MIQEKKQQRERKAVKTVTISVSSKRQREYMVMIRKTMKVMEHGKKKVFPMVETMQELLDES